MVQHESVLEARFPPPRPPQIGQPKPEFSLYLQLSPSLPYNSACLHHNMTVKEYIRGVRFQTTEEKHDERRKKTRRMLFTRRSGDRKNLWRSSKLEPIVGTTLPGTSWYQRSQTYKISISSAKFWLPQEPFSSQGKGCLLVDYKGYKEVRDM